MPEQWPISGPLGLGDLLDRAFRLYRSHFWQLLGTAALVFIPIAIISGLFNAFMGEMMLAATMAGEQPAFSQLGLFGGVSILFTILVTLATAVVELALTYQAGAALYGQDFSTGRSIRSGFGRLFGYIGMRIVQGLAMLVVMVPLFCIIGLAFGGIASAFGTLSSQLGTDGGNVAAGIGTILLTILLGLAAILVIVLPALYVYARWIVAVQCLVFEGKGPVDALRRSWHLTKNQTLRVLGYTILLGLLVFLVVGLPLMILSQAMFFILPASPGLAQGISAVFEPLVNLIWQPVYVAALVLLYYDLRVRRESYDLAARVDQIEAASGLQ